MKYYAFNKISSQTTLLTPNTINHKKGKGVLTYRRRQTDAKLEVGDKLVLGILTTEKTPQVGGEVTAVEYRDHKGTFISKGEAKDAHGVVSFLIYDGESSAQTIADYHKQNAGK